MATTTYSLVETTSPLLPLNSSRPQGQTHIASTADGSALAVVWTEIYSATDRDIQGSSFTNVDGVLTQNSFISAATTGDIEADADIAWSQAGNEFVVSLQHVTGTDLDIEYKSISPANFSTSPPIDITTSSNALSQASIAANSVAGSGTALGSMIAWIDTSASGATQVRYRGVDTDGTPTSVDALLKAAAAGTSVSSPAIAALSLPGAYVIAWEEDIDTGAGEDWVIKSKRVFQNGNFEVAETIIANETGSNDVQRFPQVLGLTNGNYVVAYVDSNGGSSTDFILELDVRSGTNNSVVANEVTVSNPVGDANFGSSYGLAQISNNHFVVTYSYTTSGSAGLDIYAAVFELDGRKVLETQIASNTNGVSASDVAGLTGGTFATSWQDFSTSSQGGNGFIGLEVDRLVRTTVLDPSEGFDAGIDDDVDDIVTGDATSNVINTRGGNDQIDGGGGTDSMVGGSGNDTYAVDSSDDQVFEFAGQGDDRVFTTVTYDVPVNVEVLIMSGSGDIDTNGTDGRDIIIGNVGNNTINGAGGIDVMQGEGGNDTYAVDNSSDAVIEAVGGGDDVVYTSVDYIMDANQEVETAILTGNATVLRGDDSDNQLFGSAGVNVLEGKLGTDYLLGLGGDDIFQVTKEANATDLDVFGDFEGAGVVGGDRVALDATQWGLDGIVTQVSQTSFIVSRADGSNGQQFIIANLEAGNSGLLIGDDYYFA